MKTKIPCKIEVDDYHEFDYLKDQMRKIFPELKIKEVGFNYDSRDYVGIAYVGNLNSITNKILLHKIRKEIKSSEME